MASTPRRGLGARFTAHFHRDVPVPMRDGAVLRADVWIPERAERVPVLLERMPYDKSVSAITTVEAGLDPLRAVDAGYAVVIQDTRGRYASDGAFDPYIHELRDGVDTIEWCAELPFCNGRVGMFGASYFGTTQLLAAAAAPPALQGSGAHDHRIGFLRGLDVSGRCLSAWLRPVLGPADPRSRPHRAFARGRAPRL